MKVLNFWFSPARHYFYSNVACNIVSKYVFVTSTPLVEEMILWPCTFSLSSVLKLILSFCMIIYRLEISIKFELSFLSFFVSFCRLLHLYRKIRLSKWKNCRSIFISCLNSWKAIKIATKINEKQWFLFASNFFRILYPHCCPSKLHRKANEIQIFRIRLLFPFFLSTHCITTGWFSKLHR